MKKKKKLLPFQKIAIIFWLLIIVSALLAQSLWPQILGATEISNFLQSNQRYAIIIFLGLVCLRPLILIPSTAFVFAGLLVFDAWTVFILSMIGVAVSGTGVYFLAEFLGFNTILERRYQKQISRYKPAIKKYGTIFIGVWSAFPLVPDDLICYLAGALEFSYWRFVLAFTIGGAIPIAVYSFGGEALFQWLT